MPILFLLFFVLFTAFHLYLTKSSLKRGVLLVLENSLEKEAVTCNDRMQQYEEERLKMSRYAFELIRGFSIQLFGPVILVAMWTFWQQQDSPSLMVLLVACFPYSVLASIEANLLEFKSSAQFRLLRSLTVVSFGLWHMALAFQPGIEALSLMEAVWGVGVFCVAILFFQFALLLPIQLTGSVLMIYKHCALTGFQNFTPSQLCGWFFLHGFFLFASVALTYAIQSHILAKVDSDYHLSYLRAFRTILKGVSDGGMVLSMDFQILEDASSVERLLKSPKGLANTSFLDLFLDTESRERFVDFLQGEHVLQGGFIPPGLKILLQGSEGAVSLDIFCTRFNGLYLCALKEEPGQYPVPPDAHSAELGEVRSKMERIPSPSTSSGASKEVAVAFGELAQVLLVVNNEVSDMEIEEVTLSFLQRSQRDRLPTLRQFLRVDDWERLQPLFHELGQVHDSGDLNEPAKVKLQSSLKIRIPGSSDLYVRASDVLITADDMVCGQTQAFQIALGGFGSRRSRPSERQDLDSIIED